MTTNNGDVLQNENEILLDYAFYFLSSVIKQDMLEFLQDILITSGSPLTPKQNQRSYFIFFMKNCCNGNKECMIMRLISLQDKN